MRPRLAAAGGRALAVATVALGTLAATGRAHAHDPFEITTEARLQSDALELRVTMASSTAARACLRGEAQRTRLQPAGWEAARPAVEACARQLYALTPASAARTVRAALTEENDVEMTITYARPAPGPLRIEAPFLAALGDPTYGAMLRVSGEATLLGDKLLRADDPALEVVVGGGGAGRGAGARSGSVRVIVASVLAVGVVLMVWIATRSRRRRRR